MQVLEPVQGPEYPQWVLEFLKCCSESCEGQRKVHASSSLSLAGSRTIIVETLQGIQSHHDYPGTW